LTGSFTHTITAVTNDAEHPQERLVCSGKVLVPLNVRPTTASFGRVPRDAGPQRRTLTLTRGDGGPIAPELAPVTHANVQAALREVTPGERYELDIDVSPPWPGGSLRTYLHLKTGIAQMPEQKITVFAQVTPRLAASPPRLTVPATVASELTLTSRLQWSGGEPGQIRSVASSDPNIDVRWEIGGKDQQRVVLRVPSGYRLPTNGRAMITVQTDDEEAPTLRIPVHAARGRPTARVSPRPPVRKPTTRPAMPGVSRRPAGAPARPGAEGSR
jgi:hypothetical protein